MSINNPQDSGEDIFHTFIHCIMCCNCFDYTRTQAKARSHTNTSISGSIRFHASMACNNEYSICGKNPLIQVIKQ